MLGAGQISGSTGVAVNPICGHVLSVSGSQAGVGLPVESLDPASEASITVGKFLRIRRAQSILIGMVTEVSLETSCAGREQGYCATARLDMMGEIKQRDTGAHYFQRGVTDYPAIGDPAALITRDELRLIYDISGSDTIDIGHLQQDPTIGAYVNVDEMLSKHFAILGTTGVGKSSGVALILRQILDARPNLRIFLLDGHNEYARCFGDRALVLNPRNLKLPFWLFNFEETIDVFFGGRPGVDEEIAILRELEICMLHLKPRRWCVLFDAPLYQSDKIRRAIADWHLEKYDCRHITFGCRGTRTREGDTTGVLTEAYPACGIGGLHSKQWIRKVLTRRDGWMTCAGRPSDKTS